ncbi:MAG: hypothetical protein IPH62_00310 [Ignavibacteriae bacterium]|nr:hypothetical protein [Ignavibacteriota bacterium]
MLTEHYFILKILAVLIAIAYIIFRFQVVMEMISGFKKWKQEKRIKQNIDLKNKVSEYSSRYKLNDVDENIQFMNQTFVKPIKLELLKIIELPNKYSIYFSNIGGMATNINIHLNDNGNISIEPNSEIANKTSGFIIITQEKIRDQYKFQIDYTDEHQNRKSIKYLLTISDKTLEEIY